MLLEAMVALLVIVMTTAFFAQFQGHLMEAHRQAYHCYTATSVARSYLEMVLRLGVAGWHVDGQYVTQLKAIEVGEPVVKEGDQLMHSSLLPRVRFVQVVTNVPDWSDQRVQISLLAAVHQESSVIL